MALSGAQPASGTASPPARKCTRIMHSECLTPHTCTVLLGGVTALQVKLRKALCSDGRQRVRVSAQFRWQKQVHTCSANVKQTQNIHIQHATYKQIKPSEKIEKNISKAARALFLTGPCKAPLFATEHHNILLGRHQQARPTQQRLSVVVLSLCSTNFAGWPKTRQMYVVLLTVLFVHQGT